MSLVQSPLLTLEQLQFLERSEFPAYASIEEREGGPRILMDRGDVWRFPQRYAGLLGIEADRWENLDPELAEIEDHLRNKGFFWCGFLDNCLLLDHCLPFDGQRRFAAQLARETPYPIVFPLLSLPGKLRAVQEELRLAPRKPKKDHWAYLQLKRSRFFKRPLIWWMPYRRPGLLPQVTNNWKLPPQSVGG